MIRSRLASRVERTDAADVGAVCLLLAVSYAAVDAAGWPLASITSLLVVVPAAKRVLGRSDVGEAGARVLLGAAVAALGFGAVAADGTAPVGLGIGAAGCWIVLDGLYAFRHDDPGGASGLSALTGHGQRVVETLREARRPLTVPELRDRTDLGANDLEAALSTLEAHGAVDRIGNGYALDGDAIGGAAFVRGLARTAGRRLLRPFGLFGDAGRYDRL